MQTTKRIFIKFYTLVKNNIHNILPISVAVTLIIYNTIINFGAQKIGTDAVSWLLPAKFLIENKGYPYADFWDTKPPGLILFLSIWLKVFGESVYSMRFLGLTLLSVILFGIMNIYRMVFNKLFYNIIYIFSVVIFMSSLIQTQPLMIEWFGLAFSLLAINMLILSNSVKKIFFAGAFFTLAGQMKESYAPIVISAIPYLLTTFNKKRNYFIRNIQLFLSGIFIVILILVLFLYFTGIMNHYIEVLRFIMEYNSPTKFVLSLEIPKSTFIYLQYKLVIYLLIILGGYFAVKYITKDYSVIVSKMNSYQQRISIDLRLDNINVYQKVALLYAIGSAIGFTMQNKFGSHYNAQMVFPIFILLILPLVLFKNFLIKKINTYIKSFKINKRTELIFVTLVVVLVFPKPEYFLTYKNSLNDLKFGWNNIIGRNVPDYSLENSIKENTGSDDCIIHVYGWGVGTTYFYAERKPCSRFFLVNLLPKDYYYEYKETLINNPPSVIVYTLGGADINHKRFESEVFNFSRVIEKCYFVKDVSRGLHVNKYKNDEMKKCIKDNS